MKKGVVKGEASKEKEQEQLSLCYEYKKPGHFKADCPLLKKGSKKYKKKAIMATLSDYNDSSSKEEVKKEKMQIFASWLMKIKYVLKIS